MIAVSRESEFKLSLIPPLATSIRQRIARWGTPGWLSGTREQSGDMRVLRKIWVRVTLLAIVLSLLWVRFNPYRTRKPHTDKTIIDRAETSPLNRPGGGAAPADAYEVYAALYQAPMDEPLAFAEDSVTDIPQVNGSCLQPATAQERELTDAFTAANGQSHRWEQKFAIPQGYRLLSHEQAGQALGCLQAHAQDGNRCGQYRGIRHVRFLGVPGFDPSHTRALVSVVKMCGGYCGNGGIFEVEKAGGTWKRADTADFTRNCSWMY
jgi:hypothetical protein